MDIYIYTYIYIGLCKASWGSIGVGERFRVWV